MDKVFEIPIEKQFEFDARVASVFDDMLDRSIPFYSEVITLICDIANSYTKDEGVVVDLGCSTANTLLALRSKVDKKLTLLGFDNSSAMLCQAQKKIDAYGADIKLENADILELNIPKSDVIIANYMLQFVRPMQRVQLIKKIYNSLKEGGIFILSEKIIFEDKKLNKNMIDIYYNFKKSQGYSEFEISQKREALENVLVPYSEDENKKMVLSAKFKSIETIFKWGNFVTFLAKK
ncbi:MAG: carboxy-S-adenosyl-L-methionine synthase CmoA [Epsilonproteobacteria bacterium]|nr:carboxy-S-adenosyl-L-methionine synthase CmoA [Campylobacterota bacterium]